jgi:hypothetical protein
MVRITSKLLNIKESREFMALQRRERPQPSTSDWNVKSEDMLVFDMNASEWVRII